VKHSPQEVVVCDDQRSRDQRWEKLARRAIS
jgi:hypothetical protein